MDKWDICQLWLDDIGREGQLATTSGKITGVQNSKKNRLAALRSVDDAPHVSGYQENIIYGGSK